MSEESINMLAARKALKRSGRCIDGDITRVVSGWRIDEQEVTADSVIVALLTRLERLERVVSGGIKRSGTCAFCGDFLISDGWLFFDRKKTCLPCFEVCVTWVHSADGHCSNAVNVDQLARRIVSIGLHRKDPNLFDHICEYLDCGDDGDDDYVNMRSLLQKTAV